MLASFGGEKGKSANLRGEVRLAHDKRVRRNVTAVGTGIVMAALMASHHDRHDGSSAAPVARRAPGACPSTLHSLVLVFCVISTILHVEKVYLPKFMVFAHQCHAFTASFPSPPAVNLLSVEPAQVTLWAVFFLSLAGFLRHHSDQQGLWGRCAGMPLHVAIIRCRRVC